MTDQSNKQDTDDTEDLLMSKLKENFSEDLSPEIKRSLQKARHRALDSFAKPDLFHSQWLLPSFGTAAALAVGVSLFLQTQNQPEFGQLIANNQELNLSDYVSLSELDEQDTELLNASLDQDLNLEFYAWLELQPEFME